MLVAGGRGLVGGAVAQRLQQAGHEVVLAGRSERHWPLDLAALPPHHELVERLRGFDLLVNAVGIFQAQGKQSFDAVHVNGVRALFEAALEAGIHRFVHVSALGASVDADTGYFASKGTAEAWLCGLAARVVIVRPSLVFSPRGTSTRFFARLAAAPLTPLPDGGWQPVQPVHVDDLAEAIVHAADMDGPSLVFDAVGARALPLREYLALFSRALGRTPRILAVGSDRLAPLLGLAERLGGGLVGADALKMLRAGSTSDPAAMTRLLGHGPRDPREFFDAAAADGLRAWLRQGRAIAWMRASLVALWLGTAWVSLWGFPRAGSHALLARLGLQGTPADIALWSGAVLDAALGIGLLLLPRRRRLYQAQLLLVAAYTVLISAWLPEFWLHPFGPLLKNLPVMAMIGALLVLDRPGHGPGAR